MSGWAGSTELDSEGEELFWENECDVQILEDESWRAGCFGDLAGERMGGKPGEVSRQPGWPVPGAGTLAEGSGAPLPASSRHKMISAAWASLTELNSKDRAWEGEGSHGHSLSCPRSGCITRQGGKTREQGREKARGNAAELRGAAMARPVCRQWHVQRCAARSLWVGGCSLELNIHPKVFLEGFCKEAALIYEFPEQLTIEESTLFLLEHSLWGAQNVGEVSRSQPWGPRPNLNLRGDSMLALGIYIASLCGEPGKILQTRFLLVFFALSGQSGEVESKARMEWREEV